MICKLNKIRPWKVCLRKWFLRGFFSLMFVEKMPSHFSKALSR